MWNRLVKVSYKKEMPKGVISQKNRRPRTVVIAVVLSMLLVFLTGCTADDFNIFKFLDGKVGTPQASPDVNIKIPDGLDFEYEISQELRDFLQSLDSFDIESITSIEDIEMLLQNIDVDIDVDLEQLLKIINNMNAPKIPVADIGGNIGVAIAINCETLDDYDPVLAGTATTGGMILNSTTISVTSGATVNDVMNQLLALTGVNIPVVIDGSGNVISINGVADATRTNVNDFLPYNCFWVCSVNDDPPVGGSQGYQLQDGDEIHFYYRCDPV